MANLSGQGTLPACRAAVEEFMHAAEGSSKQVHMKTSWHYALLLGSMCNYSALQTHFSFKFYMANPVAERLCRAAVEEFMHDTEGSRNQWRMKTCWQYVLLLGSM